MLNLLKIIAERRLKMIYLDNSATTPVASDVLETFVKVNENFWGNPSSLHAFGAKAEQLLIQAEKQILTLLKADQHKVLFTSGATESNNLAIKGVCEAYKNRGRHIITTKVEHDSVYETVRGLEANGFDVTYIDIKGTKEDILKAIESAIRPDTILISMMHVNSEMGRVLPVYEVGQLIKKYPKIKFHVDAVQSVGKLIVDIKKMNVDLLSLSAHKIHGIKGSGALIVNQYVKLMPQITGGHQMYGLRAGTIDVASAVALAKAVRLITEPINQNYEKTTKLTQTFMKQLTEIEGVSLNRYVGEYSPYIINLTVAHIKGETLVHALEEHQIYISSKSACASKTAQASRVLLALGLSEQVALNSVRISLSDATTKKELDAFITALKTITVQMRKEMMK